MNIYIFGYTGMLGNYIFKLLSLEYPNIIGINRKDIDILNINYEELDIFLNKKNINENDVIINAIGIIPQSLTKNPEQYFIYYKINSIFPLWLALLSKKYNFNVIHATTDCVFNGDKGNYIENDIHTETNDYGRSKSLGENNELTIIRTSIIGEEIYNKKSLLEWIISNKNNTINGYTNHYWNGITCYQFAKIVKEIIEKKLYWKGVKHIFSPDIVSKYELSHLINNIYNLNININEYTCEKKIDKTLNTNNKIIFDIPNIEKQIIEQYNFLNK